MQIALVDGERSLPLPGIRGICPWCRAETISHCGPRRQHHWAHKARKKCDPWWENETAWHRAWKSLFPEECREINHVANDGEVHRADVKTPTGIVIEIQHSAMPDAERSARENFYGNLAWVIDALAFRSNFHIGPPLPDPASEMAADIYWLKAKATQLERAFFFRLSENRDHYPDLTKANLIQQRGLFQLRSASEIAAEVRDHYIGHHQFIWKSARRVWLEANCPVYFDLGGDVLARLDTYDESKMQCVRLVSKAKFVRDALTTKNAAQLGI